MIRTCAVIAILTGALVLGIEKPELVAACNASNCGLGSAMCTCYCGANSVLSVLQFNQATQSCSVRAYAKWDCAGTIAELQWPGTVMPGCNTPDGKCSGNQWELGTPGSGADIQTNDCSGGLDRLRLVLTQSCDYCDTNTEYKYAVVLCEQ